MLVYHAVADRTGDRDFEIVPPHAADLLDAHLRHLRRHYRVVSAESIVEAVRDHRPGDPPPVALTFDDDLPSHVRLAAPVLERHGVRATFFLTGAGLDGPCAFWWERLQRVLDAGLSADAARRLADAGGLPVADLTGPGAIRRLSRAVQMPAAAGARALLAELAGPDPPGTGLRAHEVRDLAEAGHRIGFHTLRHQRLPELGDDELERAMAEGRERLEEVAGRPVDLIAYPHGRADARVARAAARAGFARGFTTEWSPALPDDDRLLLGRLEPPHGAAGQFGHAVAGALAG